MWRVTKILTEDWCDAIEAEGFAGPLSRLAVNDKIPMGVNLSEPRAAQCLESCKAFCNPIESGRQNSAALLASDGCLSEQ
jgi:hypothetical protein